MGLCSSMGLVETIVASTSATYAPVSSSFDSVTLYCFYDGTRHANYWCSRHHDDQPFCWTARHDELQFTGVYNNPDSTALSGTFTVANQAAALEVNDTNVTTATFFGETSQRIESLDFALNNSLIYRRLLLLSRH